ncbi:hypothetical protein [Xylanibacter caecicola]|uniref:hypothetical protein n=1 Tax=Xylanibacter caecicola TaxID=2736294 RepID=UPI0025853772|nr:hypothetical protein [Xylanibacter caecicola]
MKKRYIKPCVDIIVVHVECEGDILHASSYEIRDKDGNIVGSGSITDFMPGDADEGDNEDLKGSSGNAKYNIWGY